MGELYMKRKHFIQKTVYLLLVSILFITHSMLGQTIKPDSARTILMVAVSEAQSSQKNVFLIFHATWCPWCKILETALNDPEIKTLIDNNYIVTFLDVMERGEKIQTYENPGGNEILANYGGTKSGLPFMVFLNKKGKMIANSNVMPNKKNIGYPGSWKEISAFMKLLKKTATHITNKQREVIQSYFVLHKLK